MAGTWSSSRFTTRSRGLRNSAASDPRAWEASAGLGGNPGAPDVPLVNGLQRIFINEFLAHTDPPQLDYIELYNYSDSSIGIGLCTLSDDPATNKFIIPTNT